MADGQSRGPTPPGRPAGRPRWSVLLILMGAGFVMAVVGCGAFLSNASKNDVAGALGGIAFVIGILMFALGSIAVLIIGVVKFFERLSSG